MTGKSVNFVEFAQSHAARALSVFIYGVLLCASVCALERGRTVTQFYHTGWTVKEGAPGEITSLAQTTDGYLWLGTGTGLYRFDGVRFERFEPASGEKLISNEVQSLFAPPNGGLWVGFQRGGVSFLKDGRVTNHTERDGHPPDLANGFATDGEGTLWAANYGGLARFDGARWQRIGSDWNYHGKSAMSAFLDREGIFWVATEKTLVYLLPGTRSFQETGIEVGWIGRIAQSPDGKLWLADVFGNVQTYAKSGSTLSRTKLEIEVESTALLFDREGSLWVASLGDGIRRVPFPERLKNEKIKKLSEATEIFTQKDGLTADYVWPALEDREGNIWFGTSGGLNRFRDSTFVPAAFPAGTHDFGLVAGNDGTVWAGSTNRDLMQLQNGVVGFKGVGPQITCAYRDEDGLIWLGGTSGIWRIKGDEIAKVAPLPNGVKAQVQAITKDRSGTLWVSVVGMPVLKLTNGAWTTFEGQSELPEKIRPTTALTDSAGRIWLGYIGNKIAVIDGRNIKTLSSESGLDVGTVTALHRGAKRIWVGGERGLAFFDGNRFQMIRAANGEKAFTALTGIVERPDGGVWLHGIFGVFHIPAAEIRRAVDNPLEYVSAQSFNFLDGLSGDAPNLRPLPTAIEGTDGRLWFATTSGVVWLDPTHISKNPQPPPVSIQTLTADGKIYQSTSDAALPARTANVEIDYTGLSLTIPERVRFRYKLEGSDEDWQEAGTRRQAFYNHLSPGHYRFRVIACNNDGVWNREGATIAFSIAPAFHQTTVFVLLCLTVAVGLIWMAVRWRINQVKSRLHLQFAERLSERTRIAQELHDTLLQGVFSASIQLDAVVEQLNENSPAKPRLSRVQQLMGHVMEEGRNTVRGLHSPHADNSLLLEHAFAKIKQDLDVREQIDFRVVVEGSPRPLHPAVRDEIYRIGREALTNAFRHSGASMIEVEMEYAAKYFKLIVRDNGCGINTEILRSGREGHLGLSGMRRRAEKMGAKLHVRSRVEAGTEIELYAPDHIAFENAAHENWLERLKNLYSRKANI